MIDDGHCGAIVGMRNDRGNRSTRRKPVPEPLCPPQILHDLTRARTRAAIVGSRRLTAWAMARPHSKVGTPSVTKITLFNEVTHYYYHDLCVYGRGMDWWMDLLITCTHHSELQVRVITAPLSISTIQRSPQHPLNLFQPAVFSSRYLSTGSSNGDSSAFPAHVVTVSWISRTVNSTIEPSLLSLPCRARLTCPTSTNWVPGWRPFRTNLLLFSSQVDFQLATELFHTPTKYSLHFTQLNYTQLAWGTRYIASRGTQQKTPPPTVPLLLLWAVA
jgi:hypothetical protein